MIMMINHMRRVNLYDILIIYALRYAMQSLMQVLSDRSQTDDSFYMKHALRNISIIIINDNARYCFITSYSID